MADEDWAPPEPTPLAQVAAVSSPGAPACEVPGYTDLTEVARGGDSIVYRGRQVSLGRDVAIKVIQVTEPAAVARFERELAITVRLGRAHPHIVTVLDTTTTTTGQPCLVMDFHDLGSLHDRLRSHGPLPASEVVDAGTAVADALAFAHAGGVLHRDVKPQNILLLPTSYVLSDFGIARMADAGHTASVERFSYRHASPQVLDGIAPTVADDVWSLGSTLFTLLDGRAPFAADDPAEDTALAYLRRVRTGQRRPLRRDDLPEGLAELVEACLAPLPEDRVPTASHALTRLRALRTEDRAWHPVSAPAGAPPPAESPPAPSPGTASPATPSPGTASPAAPSPGTASPPPTDPEAPAPAAGAPIAPSALAHLSREPAPDDADVTGMAPAGGEGTSGPYPATAAEAERPRGGWRRVAAFVGGMLLAGAAIGIGSALIGGDEAPVTPTATPTANPVPTATGSVPAATGPAQATVSDADLAPQNLVVVDHGTSAELSWLAPADDVAFLTVLSVTGSGSDLQVEDILAQLPATATEYTVEGLDPDAVTCYAVVGYRAGTDGADAASGSSAPACTG